MFNQIIVINKSAIDSNPKQLLKCLYLNFFLNKKKIGSYDRKLITQIDDLNKSDAEKTNDDIARCKLASVYRLVDLKGWSWSVYNHITVSFTV